MRCTPRFGKRLRRRLCSDGAVHPADAGTSRENASAGPNARLAVAPALWTIGGVGCRRVADVAAGHFMPIEAEAGLLLWPVDDEGQPHRFPAVAGIERRQADVALAIHFSAFIQLHHDASGVAEIEHRQ